MFSKDITTWQVASECLPHTARLAEISSAQNGRVTHLPFLDGRSAHLSRPSSNWPRLYSLIWLHQIDMPTWSQCYASLIHWAQKSICLRIPDTTFLPKYHAANHMASFELTTACRSFGSSVVGNHSYTSAPPFAELRSFSSTVCWQRQSYGCRGRVISARDAQLRKIRRGWLWPLNLKPDCSASATWPKSNNEQKGSDMKGSYNGSTICGTYEVSAWHGAPRSGVTLSGPWRSH
jgi:hypothetical protein